MTNRDERHTDGERRAVEPTDGESGEGFHPLGAEREAEFTAMLEETEYDAELGMELAKDAQAVTRGELSEAEFYDRHHDAVVEEFGEDERQVARPTGSAGSNGPTGADRSSAGDESRRGMLKKAGLGAGVLGIAAWGTAENAGDDGGSGVAAAQETGEPGTFGEGGDHVQWGMAIDLEICDGCLSCVVACQQENGWDQGSNWMYVLDYEDTSPGGRKRLVRPCQHCTDAPCEKACPTTARHTRQKDGLVLTDYDVCIGCRYCQVACPYGVNYFQWNQPSTPAEEIDDDHIFDERGRAVDSRPQRGTMGKCTFCPTRQDGNMGEDAVGTVACEDACPPGAINFGNMNDPESPPQQYLEDPTLARAEAANLEDEQLQAAVDVLTGEVEPAEPGEDGLTEGEAQAVLEAESGSSDSTFRLLEEFGTDPNIVYIGNEPGPNAEQVPGPISYEDVGETDVKKEVLDRRTVDGDFLT